MRIDWFIEAEDDDGSEHFCTTEGEMPRVGDTVFLRRNIVESRRAVVVHANSVVSLGTLSMASVEFPPEADTWKRLAFLGEHIEREYGGVMGKLKPETREVEYGAQRGEVTVRVEKKP